MISSQFTIMYLPKYLKNAPAQVLTQSRHCNLGVFIIISALSYLLHLLSLHKSLVYPRLIYNLYNTFSEDEKEKCSSAKYTMRN